MQNCSHPSPATVAFLEDVSERVKETKQPRLEQPLLFLRLQVAQVKLNADDLAGCSAIIEQGKVDLDAMHDVSTPFHCLHDLLMRNLG